MGAKNITSDLAIGFKVSLESAEKIKLFLSKVPERVVIPEEIDLPPKKFGLREKRKEVFVYQNMIQTCLDACNQWLIFLFWQRLSPLNDNCNSSHVAVC